MVFKNWKNTLQLWDWPFKKINTPSKSKLSFASCVILRSRVLRGVYDTLSMDLTWHIVGWLPISLFFVSGGGMNCVSCDICVYHLWKFGLFVFFPWIIPQLQSDCSLSCDHGLDYASYCENNNNNNPREGYRSVTPLLTPGSKGLRSYDVQPCSAQGNCITRIEGDKVLQDL